MTASPLIVALDVATVGDAVALMARLGDAAGHCKVGLELYAAAGPAAVEPLETPVFLDLKLHDIPTTVERTVRALRPLAVSMLTVHALGGRAMLEAAAAARHRERILAVTILTSLDDTALAEVGLPPAAEAVPALARLAREAGCDGVVCAAADLPAVRAACPPPFLLVTPGMRPAGAAPNDQARAATPAAARAAGADHVVVGRPITRAPDPAGAARAILEEMRDAEEAGNAHARRRRKA